MRESQIKSPVYDLKATTRPVGAVPSRSGVYALSIPGTPPLPEELSALDADWDEAELCASPSARPKQR